MNTKRILLAVVGYPLMFSILLLVLAAFAVICPCLWLSDKLTGRSDLSGLLDATSV